MYWRVNMLSSGPKADTEVAVVGSPELEVDEVGAPVGGAGVLIEDMRQYDFQRA